MPTTPREIVDGYLGPRTYEFWQQLSEDSAEQRARFDRLEQQFRLLNDEITLIATDDIALLDRLTDDYEAGMELVQQGQLVKKEELEQIYELTSLATALAEDDNDLIQQVLVSGVVQAIGGFPFALLKRREEEYADAIAKLKRELTKAKALAREVWAQVAFDSLMIGITLLPGAGLSIKIMAAANSYIADELLGPEKTPVADKLDNTCDIAGPLLDATESIKRFGARSAKIAKRAGNYVTIVGFTLHADEVRTAYSNIGDLKSALEKAERATASLARFIDKNIGDLWRLRAAMIQVRDKIRDRRLKTFSTRRIVHDTCRKFRYSGSTPKRWTIMPKPVPPQKP